MARAQTAGVNLSWDDCGGAGSQNMTRESCTGSDAGQQVLYASLVAPAGLTLKSANLWFGLISATPTLPPWWMIGDPPSCRAATSLTVSYGPGCPGATDYWSTIEGGPFGSAAIYVSNPPPGTPHMVPGTNHAGINTFVAVSNDLAYEINAGQEYYLMTLTLTNASSATCGGCDTPVCILFNLVELTDPPMAISGPPSGGRDFVTWQGGDSAPCAEVPVRNVTWGRVKSLYR
jgi:hypothetical protein